VSDTTTAPTDLDVERYVQLAAFWTVITGDEFRDALADLLPDLAWDSLVVEITDRERGFSHEGLFEKVIPAELDEIMSDALALIHARVELLIARLLRALDGKSFERDALYFDQLAANSLGAAADWQARASLGEAGDDE